VAVIAALLRIVVMLGYPPAMFFNDSYNYMTDAMTRRPDTVRMNGYPFALRVLEPLHSLALVTGLQALAGLAMGVALYAVLRRRGLPWWGATLCALPVLFDAYELQLEHMVASDVLFYTLLTAALILLCWTDRPPLTVVIIVGLLVGYSATVRSVGEAMLVVFVVGLVARRMGWRRVVATAVAGLVPIVGYMVWFHSSTGRFAMGAGDGTFLYSRVQSFAECSEMNPPASMRPLCDPRPPSKRPNSQEYLWSNATPLAYHTSTHDNAYRFTPQAEKETQAFAVRAIEAQPLDYARVVGRDILTTFGPKRANTGNSIGNLEGTGSLFQFDRTPAPVPGWVRHDQENSAAAKAFGGANWGRPRVVQPWAGFLWLYQHLYLRGPLLFLFVLAGFGGIVLGFRRKAWRQGRWGGLGLLPWLTGVALIVLPPVTAGFSYRYSLAAIPAICLAAGLAFAGRGNLITWFRERTRARAR
jgi:hypothetical protein